MHNRLSLGAAAATVALALLACSGDDNDADPTTPSTDPTVDPYDVYLQNMPEQPADWTAEWPLSREDAQTRALLGCDQTSAPGTIDAVLADAYTDLCP